MDLIVPPRGPARWGTRELHCARGRTGVTATKREGDGATPVGSFPFRRALYRADRLAPPETVLPLSAIARHDGWCDAPDDPQYNRPVRLPYPASCEHLWRDDRLYDIVVVVGHNDAPPRPGLGSAIFVHVARPDYGPTEGCIALSASDLLTVLADAGQSTCLVVEAQI